MQLDFHYYATYCAAFLAGCSHEESLTIATSAQFVDCCTESLLAAVGGPRAAATTQLQLEMMDADTDPAGLCDITRIWASFHFLPGDLYAKKEKCGRRYLNKYRLICNVNGPLVVDTVELVRNRGCVAAGVAMHVLADTWAHRYFAGTPSLVINNTNDHFYELIPSGDGFTERKIRFNHNPASADDIGKGTYTNTLYQPDENSVMNLGHGRAGHLPDYACMRYKYLPAWGGYEEIVKDNPSDYMHAFCQMVYAIRSLREDGGSFRTCCYDEEAVRPYRETIEAILTRRRTDASADWKAFGEVLSGCVIPDFDAERVQREYREANAAQKDATFLGQFVIAALAQKSMVTNRIFKSGNLLAGFSVGNKGKKIPGIKVFQKLLEIRAGEHGWIKH